METNISKRLVALFLTVLMIFSSVSVTAFAQDGEQTTTEQTTTQDPENGETSEDPVEPEVTFEGVGVASSEELEEALSSEAAKICITADFELDRTFYITRDVTIYSVQQHTLTRKADFADDIFVVGEAADGTVCSEKVTLIVGTAGSKNSDMLIIDGNKSAIAEDFIVTGTVFFVCKNGQVDLHPDLTVTNCEKKGNERALDKDKYTLCSDRTIIGGPVAIIVEAAKADPNTIADGRVNVYGGKYTDNSISGGTIHGGVFFNHSKLYVYDGTFENNTSSSRAAVFYNYRTMHLYKAIIRNNTAESAGGAIYLPSSSGAKLYIGGSYTTAEPQVVFKGNPGKDAGAISSSGTLVIRNALFEGNTSTYDGGAIFGTGSYDNIAIYNSTFTDNSAGVSGGAIFITSKRDSVDVELLVKDSEFSENKALKNHGGAIYVDYPSRAYVRDTSFSENSAVQNGGAVYVHGTAGEFNYVTFNGNTAANGGALYASEDADNENASTVVMNKVTAIGNSASKGGVVNLGVAEFKAYNSEFKNNSSVSHGSALHFSGSAKGGVYNSLLEGNSCTSTKVSDNCGAVYLYTKDTSSKVTLHTCTLKNNTSNGLGGGILISGPSILDLYNITATGNSAAKGGLMYETVSGSVVTISGLTVSGNTATAGGPIIWGNTYNAKLYINKNNYTDSDVTTALDDAYWSAAIVNKLTVSDSDATVPEYEDYTQPEFDIKKHEGSNHTYEAVVTATCTQDGLTIYTCACGEAYAEELEALGHEFTEEIINDAHLKEKGDLQSVYYYSCSRCDEISTEDTYTVLDADINNKFAEISGITAGLTVEGTDTANAVVRNEAEITLDFSLNDESIGRHMDAWWVGVKILAPEGMTAQELEKSTYRNGAAEHFFWDKKDSEDSAERHFITVWVPVTQQYIENDNDGILNYRYEFDWDGNGYGISTQKITISVDTSKLNRLHSAGCTEFIDEAEVAPDCVNTGKKAKSHCSVCGLILSDGQVIDARGHDETPHEAQTPTCTAIGWDEYVSCSRCPYTTYVEIPATGHSFTNEVEYKAATCTAGGNEAYKQCEICNKYFTGDAATNSADAKDDVSSFVIPKLGHSYETAVTAPTCTEEGYTTYTCACSDTYIADYVDALKHTYTNACDNSCNRCKETRKIKHSYKTVTTPATLSKDGKVENKCSVCGYVSSKTTVYYPKTITLSATSYTYNGKTKKPTVTVKDSKKKTVSSSNYTVSYSSKSPKSVGKYSVTITFKGKYSGKKVLYFNILPSKTSKISVSCDTTAIKASWKKVTGATGYKVELLNSKGKVVKSETTTKNSYTFKKLSKVTTYKIRVTAYTKIDKKAVYSTVSTTITTSTAPAKVTLSKVTAGSKSAALAWKTVSGASGYEVQYSTSSKFKSAKTATVKKGSSKKTTIKKLTKGKKYYFKVRAYKTVDGNKVYGAWSSAKSVKVK